MIRTHRLVSLVLVAGLLAGGCNSAWLRRAAGVAGEGAAYGALAGYLQQAGVRSADRFVDALRLVVKDRDYPAGAAAFAVALAEHNSAAAQRLTSAQAIALLRQAQPIVSRASRSVGNCLSGFCNYLASR